MMIFGEPSFDEIKKASYLKRMKKAKNLNQRITMFLADLEKSTFTKSQKEDIRNEATKWLTPPR